MKVEATHAPERPRQPWHRTVLSGGMLLVLALSLTVNVLLYRRAELNYMLLTETQLDPYGLRHPDFPPDAASGPAHGLPLVVFLGDSRARDWPAPSVAGYRFISRGVGGQTTAQVRGRFDEQVAPRAPRVVVLQAGINDLKSIGVLPHRRDEIVADCKANLRALVERARAGGATVILTTIFPPGPVSPERRTVWSPEIERAVEDVNADVRTLEGDHVVVLDAWSILQQHGRLRNGYGLDTLHLNARGYAALNIELTRLLTTGPPATTRSSNATSRRVE
jgi:lysophospholipase L1-like esterase